MNIVIQRFDTPNKTNFLLAAVIAIFVFLLAPQVPFHTRVSALDIISWGLIALLLVLHFNGIRPQKQIIPVPILILLAIMALSMTQLMATFIVRDFILFLGVTLFAVLAMNYTEPRLVINAVAFAGLLMSLLTVWYAIFIQTESFDGAGFRGAFFWSNYLPISLMFTVPSVAAFSMKSTKHTYIARSLLISLVFTLIVFSTAKSALVSFIVTMLAWAFFALLKQNVRAALLLLFIEVILALFVFLNWEPFTAALGKDPDMSGRLPLWEAYWVAIQKSPWSGFGWHLDTLVEMPLGQLINQQFGVTLVNANNEFLNWWALTGIFGALLAIACVISLVVIALIFRHSLAYAKWVFLSGIALLVSGIAEVAIQHPGGWLMLVLNWTYIGIALGKHVNDLSRPRLQKFGRTLFINFPKCSQNKTVTTS